MNEIIGSNPVYNISVPGLKNSQTSLHSNNNEPAQKPESEKQSEVIRVNGHLGEEEKDYSRGTEEIELHQQIDDTLNDEEECDEDLEIPPAAKQEVLLRNQHEISQQQQRQR